MRGPGFEPGSSAWKAEILTTVLPAPKKDIFRKVLKLVISSLIMRILYGVCGEGFGHSAIASEVIPFLKSKGHKVKVVTYGKGLIFLKGFDIIKVEGFIIKYEGGGVHHLKTAYANAKDFPKNFLNLGKIRDEINNFDPEICISDNEPIVTQTAYLKKIPLVSFSALNSFVFNDIRKPVSKSASSALAKAIILAVMPKADVRIAVSLTDKTYTKKGVIFTSPVLREDIRKLKPKKENFVLVYLAKSHDYLLDIFSRLPENFVIYGSNSFERKKNIVFRKNPQKFARDFGKCKAVVSNSGFSVVSEAIYLRKPIFMIPVRGQYEQYYNASLGKRKGIGEFSERPTERELRKFLSNLKKYENKMKLMNYDVNEPLNVLEKEICLLN